MRKVGIPVTIRVDENTLDKGRRQAVCAQKPLRTYLREIVERTILRKALDPSPSNHLDSPMK